jgi:hypothetical protein
MFPQIATGNSGMCPSADQSNDRDGQFWTIVCKLRGVSEFIKHRGGEPSLDEGAVNFGIGEVLTDLADQLDELGTGNSVVGKPP